MHLLGHNTIKLEVNHKKKFGKNKYIEVKQHKILLNN